MGRCCWHGHLQQRTTDIAGEAHNTWVQATFPNGHSHENTAMNVRGDILKFTASIE